MTIRVRIRCSGQVVDMLPAVALAMINAGTAVRFEEPKREFAAVVSGAFENAAKFLRTAVR